MTKLKLDAPLDSLTAALVNVESVSGAEKAIADVVEASLAPLAHLTVQRDGDAVIARTDLGRAERVLVAGHLDTVPIAGNVPARFADGRIHGCGTSDMKSGLAVMLALAARLSAPGYDVTWVFYDAEEVEAERNGLGRLARTQPVRLAADLAVLMEPTSGRVEAGCQGTLRAAVSVSGHRAHSARAWLGDNAIHGTGTLLATLAAYLPREPVVDGCTYHEGLSAVAITGGVAGNVIPDECTVTVNFRFAPDRTEADAIAHVRHVLAPYDVVLLDSAPGARPGLDRPLVQSFVAATGEPAVAKYGWTDVARFAELGIPALNYGPGDPNLAHTVEESVDIATIDRCATVLGGFLGG